GIRRDRPLQVAEVDDRVTKLKAYRIIFQADARFALVLNEIRKVRAAVLVKVYPDLGAPYLGRVDLDIARQLPCKKVVDRKPDPGIADKPWLAARGPIVKCRVLEG